MCVEMSVYECTSTAHLSWSFLCSFSPLSNTRSCWRWPLCLLVWWVSDTETPEYTRTWKINKHTHTGPGKALHPVSEINVSAHLPNAGKTKANAKNNFTSQIRSCKFSCQCRVVNVWVSLLFHAQIHAMHGYTFYYTVYIFVLVCFSLCGYSPANPNPSIMFLLPLWKNICTALWVYCRGRYKIGIMPKEIISSLLCVFPPSGWISCECLWDLSAGLQPESM